MNRILRINGEAILNFTELKKVFSPWLVFDVLQDFIYFSKIHCLPLSDIISPSDETEEPYIAEYITKEFWLNILNFNEKTFEGPVKSYFKYLIYNLIGNIEDKEKKEQLEKEIEDLKIYQKIAHICLKGNLRDKDAYIVIILLAICELAEEDALTMHFENTLNSSEGKDKILCLQASDILPLQASSTPYIYAYHDSDILKDGETIETVRIDAKTGTNKYDKVRIQLYSEKSKKIISETILNSGESVYCNVAGGRIIKFLPTISLSDDMCISRTGDGHINILSVDSDSWQLSVKEVSSFCTGTSKEGFILIQNGHINMSFYKGSLDSSWATQLLLLNSKKIVEVKKTENEILFLTNDGKTYSDNPYEKNLIQNTVSLDNLNRGKKPEITGIQNPKEFALSNTQKSLCVKTDEGKNIILFNKNGKDFKISKKGEILDKITVYGGLSSEI